MSGENNDKVPFGKSDIFRRFRLATRQLIGRQPRFRLKRHLPMGGFAVWRVHGGLPQPGRVTYVPGVGKHIELDLAIAELKSMEVHALNPTPNSAEWPGRWKMPADFHFRPWVVADRDGSFLQYLLRLADRGCRPGMTGAPAPS